MIKLNFDVTVWGEGFSTVACVARDETDKLIPAAGFLGDHGTDIESEMQGMLEALRLYQMHLSNKALWVERDALEVIEGLHGISCALEPSVLLVDAWRMLRGMDVYKISHSYREGNRCAHWITRRIKEKGADILLFADFPS